MNLPTIDASTLAILLAGAAGAFVSLGFITATAWERLVQFVSGLLIAFYTSPWVHTALGPPLPTAAFLMGLFGMAVVAGVMAWWKNLPIAELWDAALTWLRRPGAPKDGS